MDWDTFLCPENACSSIVELSALMKPHEIRSAEGKRTRLRNDGFLLRLNGQDSLLDGALGDDLEDAHSERRNK